MPRALRSLWVADWAVLKLHAPRKRLRARFLCTHCVPILTTAWPRLILPLASSASKCGSTRAIFCQPDAVSLEKHQRLFRSQSLSRVKSVVMVAVIAALAVEIVVRVRKETDHRETGVLALLAHKVSEVSVHRATVHKVIVHRATEAHALRVHRATAHKATVRHVHRVSVVLVKVESVSRVNR